MTQKTVTMPNLLPNYKLGIPFTLQYLLAAGMAIGLGGLFMLGWLPTVPRLLTALLVLIGLVALTLAIILGLVTSLRVRLAARKTIMEAVDWRGDEIVLDVGCGNGFLLLAAAKQLITGKAIGIDVWQAEAGAQNAASVWHNAQLEGVRDRIDVQAIDARKLPFDNATFDVIVSSLALHHMGSNADRQQALQEMLRVLKPGGQILLYDFFLMIGQAAAVMRRAGIVQVKPLSGLVLRVLAVRK